MYKLLKKAISPTLKSKLRLQIHNHKSANHRYHRDIVCQINKYTRPHISAYMLTTDAQGDEGGTIVRTIFELKVAAVEDGLNQLTIEVQKATSKYPQFEYLHLLRLFEDDAHYYLRNREKLSLPEKADMIISGEETKFKTIHIYEKYSAGSWHMSDREPYVCDGDIEYGWIQPE
ncbi:MAG: hypothetical protein HN366_04365 [Deltaproteobacteria bacterium]|jgi:hypothetical protein|nr:hypothetical protein [Deltaproteobacteria bacterium]